MGVCIKNAVYVCLCVCVCLVQRCSSGKSAEFRDRGFKPRQAIHHRCSYPDFSYSSRVPRDFVSVHLPALHALFLGRFISSWPEEPSFGNITPLAKSYSTLRAL